MKNKFKFFIIFIFILFIIFSFCLSFNCFAAYPKLIAKISDSFETIKEWLIKLSTPAAAVAVGSGVFMKKFSFGDEERIRIGKKVIRGSLFSYAFILSIDLVLSTIKLLLE